MKVIAMNKQSIALAIVTMLGGLTLGAGMADASQLLPTEDINQAINQLDQIKDGALRGRVDRLIYEAFSDYNHHQPYQAYVDAQNALRLERGDPAMTVR